MQSLQNKRIKNHKKKKPTEAIEHYWLAWCVCGIDSKLMNEKRRVGSVSIPEPKKSEYKMEWG